MEESIWTRCRRIGERIGRRAVGGEGEMVAAGREASSGARICSVRGGRIGACILGRGVVFEDGGCDHMSILRRPMRMSTSK